MPREIALAAVLAGAVAAGPPQAASQQAASALLPPVSYLGVGIMEVSSDRAREIGLVEPHGVEVSSVARDSPARHAGLREADVVLTYRDERVNGIEHFARLVRETPVGGKVELGVVRGQERLAVAVEIGRRDAAASVRATIDAVKESLAGNGRHLESVREHLDSLRQRLLPGDQGSCPECPEGRLGPGGEFGTPVRRFADSRIGLELIEVGGQLAAFLGVEAGALVRSVLDPSPARDAGFRAGDVIVGFDGRAVRGMDDVRRTLLPLAAGGSAELEIVRDRGRRSLRLGIPGSGSPARPVASPGSSPERR